MEILLYSNISIEGLPICTYISYIITQSDAFREERFVFTETRHFEQAFTHNVSADGYPDPDYPSTILDEVERGLNFVSNRIWPNSIDFIQSSLNIDLSNQKLMYNWFNINEVEEKKLINVLHKLRGQYSDNAIRLFGNKVSSDLLKRLIERIPKA